MDNYSAIKRVLMDFVHKVSSNRPRYKQIYDEISTAMHENTSLNGATVSLKSLEKIFQTSKTPIYQALQMLEVSGYATRIEKKHLTFCIKTKIN